MADPNLIFAIYNEDGSAFHNLSLKKSTYTSVVMSLDDKIEGDVFYANETLEFTFKEYVLYNGVKYSLHIENPPTILKKGMTKDNNELGGMAKYSLTFYHPSSYLYNIPFTDVAVSADEKKYKSEDTDFYWIGTLTDLAAKIDKNLEGTLWHCYLQDKDEDEEHKYVDDGKQSQVLQFANQKISDVLKTAYDEFKIPFVVDGYNIYFGAPVNEVLIEGTSTPYVFKFGQGLGLKNSDRTPRNNEVITRIAGYGSETNIPYGYPKIQWTGVGAEADWDYTINNDPDDVDSYPIIDGVIDGVNVRLIKHPFTRKVLMPTVYVDSVNKKVNPKAVGYDADTVLVDYYDAISDVDRTYPTPINPLSPSYTKKQFDVKPTIENATYQGQAIDVIKSISWINDDGTPATGVDDTFDSNTGKYKQGNLQIEFYPLGFDLYAMAAVTSAMSVNIKSGDCSGCTFELEADWDAVKKSFYVNGIFTPQGTQRDLTLFPISTNASISVIVKKDTNTFGTVYPNIYQQPIAGDKFVFLGIDMPSIYISDKQTVLDNLMKDDMLANNTPYYEYPLEFDNYFLTTNTYILNQIKTNCVIRSEYAGTSLALYVKELSISWGGGALPTYKISLTDNIEVVSNAIGQVVEGLNKLETQTSSAVASATSGDFSRNVRIGGSLDVAGKTTLHALEATSGEFTDDIHTTKRVIGDEGVFAGGIGDLYESGGVGVTGVVEEKTGNSNVVTGGHKDGSDVVLEMTLEVYSKDDTNDLLDTKVDKITGYGLSQNNLTNVLVQSINDSAAAILSHDACIGALAGQVLTLQSKNQFDELFAEYINARTISSELFIGALAGNASTATKLAATKTINGTAFDGGADITTIKWGTARTLTIGSKGYSVDGSDAVTWTLADIGAAAVNQTMYIGTTQVAINRPSGAIVLTGITSIDGNAATADKVNHILTRGSYLTGDNFDGSVAATWAVDADSANTPNKVVVRDADGDFAARVISGERVYGDEGVYAGGIGDLGESFSSGYNNIEYVDEAGVVVDYVSNIESNTSSLKVYRNKLNTNLSHFVDDLGINPTHSHSQYILTSAKGQAYGVAPLDENTKLPAAYLYDYFLGQVLYGGGLGANALATLTSLAKSKLDTTDATITLTNDTNNITGYIANEGIYYIVTAAQTFAGISFEVGDWCISNGTAWTKVDNTDAVTGIKGDSESVYRIGNVNITKANIGLGNVADGAQVNVLEGVKLNGTDLTITSKVVNVNACTSITVPTGLSVAALTTGGVIALGIADGYVIPTSANVAQIATNATNITTLQGYFTDGSAKSAIKLLNVHTLWGQSFDGTANVSGALSGVTTLEATGALHTTNVIRGDAGVFSGGIGDLGEIGSSGYNDILPYPNESGNAVTYLEDNGSTLYYHLGSFSSSTHNHNSLYQPLDSDLTAIAGLTGTSGFLKKTAANTWSLDTNVYLTGITKAQVEAVLTGAITSHTHSYQAPLTGTGFVKSTAGVISYDTNTYLTTHQTIYGLTIQKNGTTIDTYAPNSAAKTINISDVASASSLSTLDANIDACIGALAGQVIALQSKNQFDELFAEYINARTISADLLVGYLKGNADTATKLYTARTLWGQLFDGDANVSGNMTGVGSIESTGNIHTTQRIYGDSGVFSGGIGDLAESGSSGYNQILLQGTGNAVTSLSDNGGSTLYYNMNKTFSESTHNHNSVYSLLGHNHDDRYYTESEIGNILSGTTAVSGYNKSNWDTAYTHSQSTSNPHGVTKAQVGLGNVLNVASYSKTESDTNLTSAISAVEIGGRNLWLDSSIDSSYVYWNIGDGVKSIDTDFLWNGQPTLKFVKGSVSSGGLNNAHVRLGLPANTEFVYSFMAHSTIEISINSSSLGHMQVEGTGSTSIHRETSMRFYPSILPANTWTKVSIIFKTPSEAVEGETFAFRSYLWYLANGGTYHFVDFQLEKGNKATDWTPAPEDVQAQIDSKANIATTIAGYGITDAYTKTETSTNYVPYTGANADVNIGSHTLAAKGVTISGNVSNSDIFTLQNMAAGSATYTRMQYIGTGRTWITGVGNLLESSLGVADKFFIFDNNASAVRMMIDTSGNTTFGGKIIKSGGTTSQFLKANGDIDETAYATAANLTTLDNNTDACIGALAGQVTDALIKNQFDEIYAEYGHIRTLSSDLFVGYLKGNADTATKLYTARNLWGQSFDGSAEIKDKMLQYCTGLGYSTTRQIELSSGKVELKDALTATSATFSGKVHTTNQVVGDAGVWAGGIGDLTDSEWTTATLSNGTQGTTYGTVRYRKIGGNAQIDGSFVYTWNGSDTPLIFTLPTSCCPIHNMTGWLYNNSNGIWRYVVGTDGKVTLIVIKSIVDGSNITSATTCIFNNMIFPIN